MSGIRWNWKKNCLKNVFLDDRELMLMLNLYNENISYHIFKPITKKSVMQLCQDFY